MRARERERDKHTDRLGICGCVSTDDSWCIAQIRGVSECTLCSRCGKSNKVLIELLY